MTPRPACGKCHSTMVVCDLDPSTGIKVISCKKCGNQYPGNKEGFYMTEMEGKMANQKGTCRNCYRPNMSLVPPHGLCWTCYVSVKGLEPDGEEYAAALKAIKERIDSGGLRGWGHGKKSETKAAKAETKQAKRETIRAKKETKAPAAAESTEGGERPLLSLITDDLLEKMKPVRIGSEGEKIIPVTLRLTVEVCVKVAAIG